MASEPKTPEGSRGRPTVALAAVLMVLAAALRLWGIRWGLPDETHLLSYHPDEFHSLRGALSLAAGDPNPHFFNYGSLYLYLVGIACLWHDSVLGQADLLSALLKGTGAHAEMAAWVLDARIVTVLCAVATVIVVFLAGKRLFGLWGGVAAGASLAVAPLHVLHSHYATVDVPLALFVALCIYLSIGLTQRRTWRACILAGAAAGLAAGVKYNGGLVVLVPVLCCLLSREDGNGGGLESPPHNGKKKDPPQNGGLESPPHHGGRKEPPHGGENDAPHRGGENDPSYGGREAGEREAREAGRPAGVAVVVAACALAFVVSSPYVLLAFPEAWKDITYELEHMRAGEPPAAEAYGSGWLFHLHPAVLLAPLAALLWTGRRRTGMLAPAVFGLLWYAMIAVARVRYARYEMPLEPLGALGLGGLLAWVLRSGPRAARWPAVGLLTIWCLAMAGVCMQRNTVLHGIDVRADMLRRVEREVPQGETIALVWEPWFNVAPVDYCNGGQALRRGPLFSRFVRPVRPLEIIGLDVDRLRESRPYAVLVSDFELDPRYDRVSPPHRQLRRYLQSGGDYRPAAHEPVAFANPRVLGPPGPDNRYPRPWLELYLRVK